MSGKDKTGQLKAVYAAKAKEDVARVYDEWAETYDRDMGEAGYRHPSICLALIARYLPRGAAPILDAGAGTGMIGEWLKLIGYPVLEALDVSEGMLAVAARKKVYSAFHYAALGTPLDFPDNHFAAVVSTGVFTSGHVGVEGLDELIRATRPGGVIVLTVKDALWNNGFSARISELSNSGTISVLEETEPYVSMPGEAGTTPSRALVFKIL